MVSKISASTDDYKSKKINSLGRAEFTREGQILICDAVGPFDKDLVQAIAGVEINLFKEIIADGEWADLTIIRKSALASSEAIQTFKAYLKILTENGINSCASALVIEDMVDGAKFMVPLIVKVFEETGTNLKVFNDLEKAKDWIRQQLVQHPE